NGTGTLGGTGRTGSVTVASGGNVNPGLSPGILNTGSLATAGTGNLTFELNGTTVGTQYDQLNVTGTVNLAATPTLTVLTGFTPPANTQFIIINNDGADPVVGTFASVPAGFTINYAGGDGNDVVLSTVGVDTTTTLADAPDPSTFGETVTLTATVAP